MFLQKCQDQWGTLDLKCPPRALLHRLHACTQEFVGFHACASVALLNNLDLLVFIFFVFSNDSGCIYSDVLLVLCTMHIRKSVLHASFFSLPNVHESSRYNAALQTFMPDKRNQVQIFFFPEQEHGLPFILGSGTGIKSLHWRSTDEILF